MGFIKNYDNLATSEDRKILLDLIETAFSAIQPQNVINENFSYENDQLKILDKQYNLNDYERVFLIGFGKGSAGISKIIESKLNNRLTKGYVIDTTSADFNNIEFTLGTHPLPSNQNLEFTKNTIEKLNNLTNKDLVLIIICGGGSVMFDAPYNINLDKLIQVNKGLLHSGADILEMNTLRKHLSITKGGGLAKILHPAKIVSLIFSDVPGNDLSFIASGPTVKDETTIHDALEIYKKYKLEFLGLKENDFTETPKENEIFNNTENLLVLSNLTALNAMKKKAQDLGISAKIFTDKFQSEAQSAAKQLIDNTTENSILLSGGETTVKVKNPDGIGGRNQEVVLSALENIDEKTLIASFDSDGWDNSPSAGAIGDLSSFKKAQELNLDINKFLNENNSLDFFNQIGDAIITDRLPSNVADLLIVYKK